MTLVQDWLYQLFIVDPTMAHLLIAMVLGAAIGLERQWRQRSAGLRTTILVCVGSASCVDLATAVAPGERPARRGVRV
jgi:putative Mg2+ transporter-C (MgtC) family protein